MTHFGTFEQWRSSLGLLYGTVSLSSHHTTDVLFAHVLQVSVLKLNSGLLLCCLVSYDCICMTYAAMLAHGCGWMC